jgi:hypothetical protein
MISRKPQNEIKLAEPMLRAASTSVLRSDLRGAGVPQNSSNTFLLSCRATAGLNKRGACEHWLAVCVRTTASK